MKTIDFSYFIERFNAGEMNEAERKWFLKELESNEKLRNEVELRKKTEMILRDHEVIKLRNKLTEIERIRAAEKPVKNPVKRISLRYAAAVAGFILVGSMALYLYGRSLTADDILDRFYKSYEVTTPSRSQQAILNSDYSTGIEYFNIHDYRNAALYFSKVLDSDDKYMESTFLNGISNFEVRNYPDAKTSFIKVIGNDDNLFIEDAQWYLALCYMRTGEMEKAAGQLTFIKNSESIHRRDAKSILRKMN
jgi:tetratricopeptide (TPR) repeat protein